MGIASSTNPRSADAAGSAPASPAADESQAPPPPDPDTLERQELFLQHFDLTADIVKSAQAAGVTPLDVYNLSARAPRLASQSRH